MIENCQNHSISVKDGYKNTFTLCSSGCDYYNIGTKSMYPTFDINDKLYFYKVSDKEDIDVCDIIMFKNKNKKVNAQYVIHRIMSQDGGEYHTKGDASNAWDEYTTKYDEIIGKLYMIEYK